LPPSRLAPCTDAQAHSRIDYDKRDDVAWMKHSLYYLENNVLTYKPVRSKAMTVETFPPKERVY